MMTSEEKAAYVNSQAACLFAEIAGMTAENMQRQHLGQSMAYVEADFLQRIEDSGCHHNDVMRLFNY
jgi:hypothetical protein